MSKDADRPRRGRRRILSAEERTLWRTVTRSVTALRPAEASVADEVLEPAAAPAAPAAGGSFALAPPSKVQAPPLPLPLAPLDRRLRQRVARGAAPLDRRIDLHGLTQEEAHHALRRFLRVAQADGVKLVLVITGKGRSPATAPLHGGERGVLKRLVPQWLRLPEFRSLVLGFEDAHAAHGGAGALYVRIRRARGKP
jgi:DNA-nicking Smr family endonuclease